MSNQPIWEGTLRKLWASDRQEFENHLLRLDKKSRRMRFAHSVSDDFIQTYASHMDDTDGVVYGYVDGGHIRAAAELKKLGDTWGHEAEAAFSVESAYQNNGIGTALMGNVIRSARNRGVHTVFMSCLAENAKMQAIARKYDADLRFECGEIVGEIVPHDPNYFSVVSEAIDDRTAYFMAVLDLQKRLFKAA